MKLLSCVQLFATPWTVAYQTPSMGFSRQECWSGLPFPSPGDLPDPGIEPGSPASQADTLRSRARQDRIVRRELPEEVMFEHLWEEPCWYRELKVQTLKSRMRLWV